MASFNAAAQDSPSAEDMPVSLPEMQACSEPANSVLALMLAAKVEDLLLRMLAHNSLSMKSVATCLEVGQGQAVIWLRRQVEIGNLVKTSRPVRYQLRCKEPAAERCQAAVTDVGHRLPLTTQKRSSAWDLQTRNSELQVPLALDDPAWSAELITVVEDSLFRLLAHASLSPKQVAKVLEASKCQAKRWLVQLEKAGKVVRTTRPAGYQWNALVLREGGGA